MTTNLRLALYQPDMPTNTGAMMRLAACLGVGIDIIEPCGFVWDDRKLKRVAMDYIDHIDYTRHQSWSDFHSQLGEKKPRSRVILLTTKATQPYYDFTFQPDDIVLMGRESAGVPHDVHESADAALIIPMAPGLRSFNVAMAAGMVLGEALRQTRGFYEPALS